MLPSILPGTGVGRDGDSSLYDLPERGREGVCDRRVTIPTSRVADTIESGRQAGAQVRRKPAETDDNSFAENLEKIGFLKELWGSEALGKRW